MPAQAGRALVPFARHGDESASPRTGVMNTDEAYGFCRQIAHRYGANFSVGFRFLPRQKRCAVYAAYAFCRWADDIADEGEQRAASGEREKQLDEWERELERAYQGSPTHPITIALADTLR